MLQLHSIPASAIYLLHAVSTNPLKFDIFPHLPPDFELDALLMLAQISGQAAWQQRYVSRIDQLKQTWLIEDHYAKPYRELKKELEAEEKN